MNDIYVSGVYDNYESLDVGAHKVGDFIQIGDQYYKVGYGPMEEYTLWDVLKNEPLTNPAQYGIEPPLGDVDGSLKHIFSRTDVANYIQDLNDEANRILEETKESHRKQVEKSVKALKKAGYGDEYIEIFKSNYLDPSTIVNPHPAGSDEANDWEQKRAMGMLWDNKRETFVSQPNYGNKKQSGISASESTAQSMDDNVINKMNPYNLGVSKSEDRKYRKWFEQATKRDKEGNYRYTWDQNREEFVKGIPGEDDPTFVDIGWKPGVYSNQNGDRITIDKFGNGYIE